MVLKSLLTFLTLTLLCTLLFEYALKSNLNETNIYYFINLALVRLEHLLPFSLCLSFCATIYNLKYNKWALLLQSLSIKNKTIYRIFWLSAILHILCLSSHYQYSYAEARRYINYERFTPTLDSKKMKMLSLPGNTILVFTKTIDNRLEQAYIIKNNKIEHYCASIILKESYGIGLQACSYAQESGFKTHSQLIFNELNTSILNKKPILTSENCDKSLTDTISTLINDTQLQGTNRAYLQKELIQKILLSLCPLFILYFIRNHYKREASTGISGYFLAITLYFIILFLSRTYTILLKSHLLQSISSLFYLLLAILLYFITKQAIYHKIKDRHERDQRVLHKTTRKT
jgi:hypothetical protein